MRQLIQKKRNESFSLFSQVAASLDVPHPLSDLARAKPTFYFLKASEESFLEAA